MATKTMRAGGAAQVQDQPIPVRTITNDDLRFALRQGLDDFLTMRGDISDRRADLYACRYRRRRDDDEPAADALLLPRRRRSRPARSGRCCRLL